MTTPYVAKCFELLAASLDSAPALSRLDLPTTRDLEAFQLGQNEKLASLKERAKLAAVLSPTFRWWQVTGTWPRDDGGWTILLCKATFDVGQVAPTVARSGRRPTTEWGG